MRILFCIEIYFCKPIRYVQYHDHLLCSDICRENYHSICVDCTRMIEINPLNAELNLIRYLLALLRAHHFLYVSMIRVKSLTLRLLISYIYIYICISDISSLRVNTSAHCSGRKQVKG